MSKLVIVESPAKAKTIGKYLGSDYVVKASMGHLRDLPKKKMSIDIEHDFQPEYVPIEGKDKIIKEIRSEIRKSDFVYLATDPDREGEAISWHIKELQKERKGRRNQRSSDRGSPGRSRQYRKGRQLLYPSASDCKG